MKKKLGVFLMLGLIIILSLSLIAAAAADKLPKFMADFGKKSNPIPGMDDIRIPYTSIVRYFGYIKPGAEPDGIDNGKKMYYLYVWIPAVAPEIGVRMVSPVGNLAKPSKNDFVSPLWDEGKNDAESFFDTWIQLEKAQGITDPKDIKSKINSVNWVKLGSNDDSSELPAQPSGNKYNSCMRITSEISNPTRALVRGLYRISFTTYKRGEVRGTFLAEVGAPVKLPGVLVEKDIDEIVNKAK